MRVKYLVIERRRNKYPVKALCQILEVPRSSYYAWRKTLGREDHDAWLKEKLIVCQKQSNFTYGYRRIRLWLQKTEGICVNLKRILRVARQLDALTQIRRLRPYIHYKDTLRRYNNLLERKFDQDNKNRFWATDITYIPTKQGMAYMCAILDQCGKMVLGYRIGTTMTSSLVCDTLRDVFQKEKVTDGLILHSDQGSQYSSDAYYKLSEEYHFSPSMSKRGCPYDNSSMENFFGTLKTECLHRRNFLTFDELREAVDAYVHFYNYERINLKDGLTPHEIRSKTA